MLYWISAAVEEKVPRPGLPFHPFNRWLPPIPASKTDRIQVRDFHRPAPRCPPEGCGTESTDAGDGTHARKIHTPRTEDARAATAPCCEARPHPGRHRPKRRLDVPRW